MDRSRNPHQSRFAEQASAREPDSLRRLGDVIYACEWSDRDVTGFEAIGWFYGTETVPDWRGESRVNLFARVDQSEWPFPEEVGSRTWREGGEDCTISVVGIGLNATLLRDTSSLRSQGRR
jgi:hypothetical protein